MFNVGGGEIIAILLIALIVLGPDKLPGAARQAGKYLNEFRRMSSGFQDELRSAMDLSSTTTTPDPTPVVMEPAQPATPDAPDAADPGSDESGEPGDPGVATETVAVAAPVDPPRNGTTPDPAPVAAADTTAMTDPIDPAPAEHAAEELAATQARLAAAQAELAEAEAAAARARAEAEASSAPPDAAHA